MIGRLLAALFLLAALSPANAQSQGVARGAYLAILGDCAGCHTNGTGPAYVGGQGFSAAFGTIYSSNITPDRATGIGGWSKDQFWRAMHRGVSPGLRYLYPAFPYAYFTRFTRADTDALYDYLRTQKPVHSVPQHNRLIFPFNIRALMWFWDAMFLEAKTFTPDPTKSQAWNRGEFLVTGPGHCGACHTPKNVLFGDETEKSFTGETVDNWFSANLTGSARDGLGRWSANDVMQYLKTGQNAHATAVGSMQEVVALSTSRMNDGDLAAIATYLKSLPPQKEVSPRAPEADALQHGEAVFVANCSSCHGAANDGTTHDYPPLSHNTLVQGRNPTTVLRVILQGSQSVTTKNAKTALSMPAFAALDDKEIADVATYIRNTWGNKAGPVAQNEVTKLRRAIQVTD